VKKIAIIQSNYIPWKGYFDIIASVDEFVLYDDAQYTRRDWRNRNLVKTPQGVQWITIPVEAKGKRDSLICEMRVDGDDWRRAHWESFRHLYGKSQFFREYAGIFEKLYLGSEETYLSKINFDFISAICQILGIGTPVTWSMDYKAHGTKTERLVNLCKAAGAKSYLSGPAARDYIEIELFEDAGIKLEYVDYDGYPEYPQMYGEFEHGVSVLDLIFNTGPNAPQFMKFMKAEKSPSTF